MHESESEVAQSCPTQRPHGLQPTRLIHPWDFPGKRQILYFWATREAQQYKLPKFLFLWDLFYMHSSSFFTKLIKLWNENALTTFWVTRKGAEFSVSSIKDVFVPSALTKLWEHDVKVTYKEIGAHLRHPQCLPQGYKSVPAICHFHRLWLRKVPARR